MPELSISTAPIIEAVADAVVIAALDGEPSAALTAVDDALGGAIGEMRERKEFTGGFAQRPMLRTLGRLPAGRLVLLGLGKPELLDTYRLHNAFTFAGQDLRAAGFTSVAVHVDGDAVLAALGNRGASLGPEDVARAVTTGLLLGNWRGGTDKSEDDEAPQPGIDTVTLHGVPDGAAVSAALEDAVVLAEATNQVRTWVTMPSNTLTPTKLAAAAAARLAGTGVELEVLDRGELERRGMGALLGVAQGSEEPPVMICARWDNGRPDGPRLALVGKGITFDTGGISIKPAGGMEAMKFDMGGGAAVIAAMWAIAKLGVRANVIGIVPATENMPGGRAYKPGDVLRSHSGKTIEVINTDAEGRIILADGLAQAKEMGATHLVDVATLTGAVVVALGHAMAAVMGSDPELVERLRAAATVGGDRLTELPIPPEYDVVLKSEVADMRNVGSGRQAGSIAAGVFLREFSGDLPWAHIDIAGTVWNDQSDLRAVPSGPSGTPVRTFVALARAFAEL
jgi:leucyl aminopeptidase